MSDAIELEIFRQLSDMKESPEERHGDDDTLFGQSIAASHKRMEKSLPKIGIQQVLHEVEFASSFHPQLHPLPS